MKIHTGICKVLILFLRNCNAGVQIEHSHLSQKTLQGAVKPSTCTASPSVMFHINGHLGTPSIGIPRMKGRTIGIPQDLSVLFRHNIWIFLLDITDPSCKFLHGRRLILKCDRCLLYIVRIDLHKYCCIIFSGYTYLHCSSYLCFFHCLPTDRQHLFYKKSINCLGTVFLTRTQNRRMKIFHIHCIGLNLCF